MATWLPRICARRSMRCAWFLHSSSTIARRQSVTGVQHDTCTNSTGNLRVAGSLCCPDSFSGRQVCFTVLGIDLNGKDIDGPAPAVVEGGAETSWSDGDEKITLQDILELTKHIKQINLPINDNLKSKLLHWEGNPEEIERINQVTVSNEFPILVMLDNQGQIDWILDGNHRLHKAIRSQAKTIPAKLIKPSDLSDKAKRVFHIKEQGKAHVHCLPVL